MSEYIQGADELIAKLSSLKKTEAKKAIRTGTRQAAKGLQAMAKRLAPHRTGTLERGIKVRSLTRSRVYTGTKVTLADIPYGSFEELGAPGHDIKALHFLQRTAQQGGRAALQEALQIIVSEIERAVTG